ncbi:MAG: hypothetical protein IAF08_16910 [Rhizobacter sp.]|nr:hypothetical protein [Chlorobiales bacterium]
MADKKKPARKMPDTVRTAGSEDVKDTDRGTPVPRPKKSDAEKKSDKEAAAKQREATEANESVESDEGTAEGNSVKSRRKMPDTVRTAGQDDVAATDD